jgi:uncharacterized membrane protein YphA (DoxX/SURF4 family)
MKSAVTIELISFLFILLFMYAGLSKLMDYQKFTIEIGQSPLLTGFGTTLPWIVIGVEVLIPLLFVLPTFRLYAFFASFSLMTMFSVYIVAILGISPYVPCSCGGVLEDLGWTEHLIFNGMFVLLALVGIILQANQEKKARIIGDLKNAR